MSLASLETNGEKTTDLLRLEETFERLSHPAAHPELTVPPRLLNHYH